MSKYETKKVFRTLNMPNEVKEELFERKNIRNGQYLPFFTHEKWLIVGVVSGDFNKKYYIESENLDTLSGSEIIKRVIEDGLEKVIERGMCKISDWLFDNGAKIHEEVLIWDM